MTRVSPIPIWIVRKAVRLARTEKPGAVHIELPEDVAARDTSTTPLIPRRFRRSVPDDKIVDQAFEILKNAKRPVIIAHSCGVPEPRRLRRYHCRIVQDNGRSIPLNEL